MKANQLLICTLFIVTVFFTNCNQQNKSERETEIDFSTLSGPYLGQKPPGLTPEIFAPSIISTEKNELNAVFSKKGDEFYYAIHTPDDKYTIMYTKQVNNIWIQPEVVSFSGKFTDVDMAFSPDGNQLYFCSKRPVPGDSTPEYNIWVCERLQDNNWSESTKMGTPINTSESETYPTFTNDGTMYFSSSRPGGKGSKDIYYSKLVNGKFAKAINLGDSINTQYGEGDTYAAPDESFLIITCWGRPEGKGLDISFKKEDGSWTRKVNMEKILKRNIVGGCPYVSPDGKYFFYTRNGDIYWVSAKIIEELKPKELK